MAVNILFINQIYINMFCNIRTDYPPEIHSY